MENQGVKFPSCLQVADRAGKTPGKVSKNGVRLPATVRWNGGHACK